MMLDQDGEVGSSKVRMGRRRGVGGVMVIKEVVEETSIVVGYRRIVMA
jgi:hypothetical protein